VQIRPTTFIHSIAVVIGLKLLGYSQFVCGHGRQQLTPRVSEQNLPATTIARLAPESTSTLVGT
jgi:hypothetical protein